MPYQGDPHEPLQRRVLFTSGLSLLLPAGGDVLVRQSPGEGAGTGETNNEKKARDAQEPQTDE